MTTEEMVNAIYDVLTKDVAFMNTMQWVVIEDKNEASAYSIAVHMLKKHDEGSLSKSSLISHAYSYAAINAHYYQMAVSRFIDRETIVECIVRHPEILAVGYTSSQIKMPHMMQMLAFRLRNAILNRDSDESIKDLYLTSALLTLAWLINTSVITTGVENV